MGKELVVVAVVEWKNDVGGCGTCMHFGAEAERTRPSCLNHAVVVFYFLCMQTDENQDSGCGRINYFFVGVFFHCFWGFFSCAAADGHFIQSHSAMRLFMFLLLSVMWTMRQWPIQWALPIHFWEAFAINIRAKFYTLQKHINFFPSWTDDDPSSL